MRVAVLTTQTPHHTYFVRALREQGHEVGIMLEDKPSRVTYPTAHPFEAERDKFEWDLWFAGRVEPVDTFGPTQRFADINAPEAIAGIEGFKPDAIVSFGTGLIRPPLIALAPSRFLNLHGGDPQHYRGLDTHLWAIWHREYAQLVTTLHMLDERLDNGAIVSQGPILLRRNMKLHELRAANSQLCAELTLDALKALQTAGVFTARAQQSIGRYYSAMPAALKDGARQRFERYTERL